MWLDFNCSVLYSKAAESQWDMEYYKLASVPLTPANMKFLLYSYFQIPAKQQEQALKDINEKKWNYLKQAIYTMHFFLHALL